jgi:hemoglobin
MNMKLNWVLAVMVLSVGAGLMIGCGSEQKKDRGFFTSGDREADQRADQRMAKAEQLEGGPNKESNTQKQPSGAKESTEKQALYERLGGEKGIQAIIDDFVPRVLADPRVNWERKGITRGGISLHRNQSVEWKATDENQVNLKKHLQQFIALATGGPSNYEGKDMKASHAAMHITNAEFDAAVGDIKATLDKLKLPNQEQKELLAIIETTRPQVVEER